MGIEYYLVKPDKKEIFYLGKHFSCPDGIKNRNYTESYTYIDYDCWDDFFWDFLRENSSYFDDISLEDTKEVLYELYEWCLDDKIYFDHDCNDNREWAGWKEVNSLSNIIKEVENLKRAQRASQIHNYAEELKSIVFVNPSYESALVGVTSDERTVYDYNLMIEYLVNTDNMTYTEAEEFIEFNTLRSLPYVQKGPIVIVENGRY